MRPRVTACLAATFAVALSGCGTVANCVGWNGPGAREIYGGVKQDVQNGTGHLNEAFHGPAPSFSALPQPPNANKEIAAKSVCAVCGVGMLAVDLPISFVADTLTLPLTVPATLANLNDNSKRKHPPKRRATPSTNPPS